MGSSAVGVSDVFCSSCGTAAQSTASFCAKCGSLLSSPYGATGSEPSRMGALCTGLVSELDSARGRWVSLVVNVMSSSEDGVPIVNREFSEKIDVGRLADDEPATFVFDTLNGVSAEATVIAWQVQSALGFAGSQGYIGADDGHEWLMVLTKTLSPTSSPRWILAMQMLLAAFQKGVMIEAEDMAIVLSHFFMNELELSRGVRQCGEKLPGFITFLQGFTYIGTATVFGDLETVESVQRTLSLSVPAPSGDIISGEEAGADDPDDEGGGLTTFREIAVGEQLVHMRIESEEQKESFREALRAIGNIELTAPFPIRSAFLMRYFERSGVCGEIEGYLYDEPLRPDRIPPNGKRHAFVFWKDLRTKLFGKPVDPATYGKWLLFSREGYEDLKKRHKL